MSEQLPNLSPSAEKAAYGVLKSLGITEFKAHVGRVIKVSYGGGGRVAMSLQGRMLYHRPPAS